MKIVSLIIIEGGYFIDVNIGYFDLVYLVIVVDGVIFDVLKIVFGMLVVGLKVWCVVGVFVFIVMCCDNILYNGVVMCEVVVEIVCLFDFELVGWIVVNVVFLNGMVDCIMFVISDCECVMICDDFGIVDDCLVFVEDFI